MNSSDDRLDLLMKKAVYGLSEAESAELEALAAGGNDADELSFEITTAALAEAMAERDQPLPALLRARIEADAERFFGAEKQPARDTAATQGSMGFWNWFGWALAGAACIALGANIYLTRVEPNPIAGPQATPVPSPERPDAKRMRERLLAKATDIVSAGIGAGNVKELKPAGDIVWSDSEQAGYIRVTGLPRNDPGRESYQLWIFDETQDPKTPIDGGVFDITTDGEAVIPIDSRLKARNPQAFAITIEKPGGVVVSKQERVAALAKRET